MEIFDKALEFYKISERLSEPEAILKAREVERLSEAGFQVLSIKSEDVSEWDTDAYVETGYPEWAALTECIIDFEVNGKQGQVSALWSDEVNYYGDLKDKLTFVDVQSYDGNSVVRHADTIQYLLKNDPAILSSLTKAITDHKGMHEDRITAVTPSEIADIYQVTVTNGREDIILDVRAGLDQRGETEVWRVRDPGDRPVFVADQYRGAAEYNSRHGHLEEAPLLSLTTDDLKVAITPLHQAAHPEVAEWRKEEERCSIEGRPYYGYGNVGAPAREFFEVFRMDSVGEGDDPDLGIDVPMTEDYRSRVAINGSDTEKDNYFRLYIDINSEGKPVLIIYDGDLDGEISKEIFETHYDRIKEATAQYVAKIQQGADEIPFDSIADDEVREVADTLQGNAAVMARLLVDEDDENDPVHYEDEDDDGDYEPDLTYVETDADRAEDLVSDPNYLAMRAEGYSHLESVESVEAERRGEPPPFLLNSAQHLDLSTLASVKESVDSDPHAYGHPNYGGTESPEHNFFDVFRTSGQEDGHYSIDVPLTHDTREDFAEELEVLPVDPEQNFYRLQISINGNGFLHLDREGSKLPELDQYLFDGYSISIREGAKNFVLEHSLIADNTADADNENDPVAYQDDRPAMTADWGEIPERAVPDDGGLLREVEGQMVASVVVPEHISKAFDVDTLDELGVHFDDQNRVELQVKVNGGDVTLDRQFPEYSYQGDFEQALFRHHKGGLQAEADKMDAEKNTALAKSVLVEGDSDFADNNPTEWKLKVRVLDKNFGVIAPIDEFGVISDVKVNPDQVGYDPGFDGISLYNKLSALLDEAKEPVLDAVRKYHANSENHILHDTGWADSRTFEHGYCVIPRGEIDRLEVAHDSSEGPLTGGDVRTDEGYPIRVTFDADGNLKGSVIPGTKFSLEPVLEGSRFHFIEAKAHLADDGIVLSRTVSGEYRVDHHKTSSSYREGERGSALYADTVSAAVDVGRNMASERDRQKPSSADNDEDQDRHRAAVAA